MTMNIYISRSDCRRNFRSRRGVEACRSTKTIVRSAMRPPGAWSPTLKKYLALATVEKDFAAAGTRLDMEVTIEHARKTAGATVVNPPFLIRRESARMFAASNGQAAGAAKPD